jgi:hypothetical protein
LLVFFIIINIRQQLQAQQAQLAQAAPPNYAFPGYFGILFLFLIIVALGGGYPVAPGQFPANGYGGAVPFPYQQQPQQAFPPNQQNSNRQGILYI